MHHIRSFNVFQSAASITDQNIQRHEVLSTRLYLSLLIVIMFTILMTTVIPEQQIQITIKNISLTDYDHMQHHYESFSCLCSSNSIPYSTFISFTLPRFHQVCSSSFVSDQWISIVFNISESNLTVSQMFLGAHFKFLANICQYAQQAIEDNSAILQSSHLVSATLLPRATLGEQINSTIEQLQMKIPNDFNHTFDFIVDTLLSNQAISLYGSNWYPVVMTSTPFTLKSLSYGMHMYYCMYHVVDKT